MILNAENLNPALQESQKVCILAATHRPDRLCDTKNITIYGSINENSVQRLAALFHSLLSLRLFVSRYNLFSSLNYADLDSV